VDTGKAFYESAGALKNGQRVWVMARLKEDFEVTKEDTLAATCCSATLMMGLALSR